VLNIPINVPAMSKVILNCSSSQDSVENGMGEAFERAKRLVTVLPCDRGIGPIFHHGEAASTLLNLKDKNAEHVCEYQLLIDKVRVRLHSGLRAFLKTVFSFSFVSSLHLL
jgi:hypothetical protein